MVLSEYIDLLVVEHLTMTGFYHLETSIFHWRPEPDSLVGAGRYNMLSSIINSELCAIHVSGVPLETVHELSILRIEHPNEFVLASCHDHISLGVPLHKVQVISRSILQGALELEVILCVPHSDLVVHTGSRHQLAVVIELNELHGLSMTG